MAFRRYYSDSEEFLMGVSSGITAVGDSSIKAEDTPVASDREGYELMLVVEDADANEDEAHFYDGASLDYVDIG